MTITVTARHFQASPHLQAYAKESVSRLTRYYDGLLDVHVILEPHESSHEPQQAELVVSVSGQVLTASERAATYETALNKAVENMTRQLLRYKEKRSAKV
jgi:putative sigma-54 modulation protein